MKKGIKNIIYCACLVIRNFLNRIVNFQEISVLCYHSISEENWDLSISPTRFEEQMIFLKKRYKFVTLEDVVCFIKKEKDLPKKAVAITFDDGYSDLYFGAMPILKKYGISATIFIVNDKDASIKNMGAKINMLEEYQIKEMKRNNIDFQFHSKTHRLLDNLSSKEIEEELDNKPNKFRYFAYPGGHYLVEAVDVLKKNNFEAGFTIRPGLIKEGTDIFLINRNVILRDMSLWQFKIRVTKAIDWYFNLSRFLKNFISK
ncbi:MAG: Polysaccharide deacetylase [Parcubacteria group bacterium GW2011_GWD2_40_9]|nr:MAG: Polysaccharide deacetylase [Parcubacteria group bacterium GW2011_GWD2_40_9]